MIANALRPQSTPRSPHSEAGTELVWIPGGTFQMGSNHHYPEESPCHEVSVAPFWIDATAVSNDEFARFVATTGYLSAAERPAPGLGAAPWRATAALITGSRVFRRPAVNAHQAESWWSYIPGASWRAPEGPGSSIESRGEHPVVHVTFADALAYASWAGKELPTEAEWEFAARGGLEGRSYCWGDELAPGGQQMANLWQGPFPWHHLVRNGLEGTAPVRSFPPNGYGLYQMCGNTWEWTCEWFKPYTLSSPNDPRWCLAASGGGPMEPIDRKAQWRRKVLKGASYLCGPSNCRRYRPAARWPLRVDASACDIGFRCVIRPDKTGRGGAEHRSSEAGEHGDFSEGLQRPSRGPRLHGQVTR
jgi:formylglycine-generating enzyme